MMGIQEDLGEIKAELKLMKEEQKHLKILYYILLAAILGIKIVETCMPGSVDALLP